MQPVLKNKRPTSYIIEVLEPVNKFTITDEKGRIYFYRLLPNGCKNFKVNIPDPGTYHFSVNAVVKEKPLIVIPEVFRIRLPKKERNRNSSYFTEYDPNQTNSPAIIYTFDNSAAKIVFGRKWKDLSTPMKVFVGLHELGHLRYTTEKFCDLWAAVEFIKMGYNPSTAIYSLTDVLKDSPGKSERVNFVYNTFLKNGIIKNGMGL